MISFFNKTLIGVIIIFLLSSSFRLSNLELIEYKSDEATTVYQTIQFFEHPYLASRGLISGTGVYNFPLFNYLIIPLGVLSKDPQKLSWIIALINGLLICAFFLLVKKYYDSMTAFLAGILLALSPWGVIFSRKIWAQDLINLFLIPFFYFLHELVLKKNKKAILPLFLVSTLSIQLHGSGLFLFSTTILILLILGIRPNFKSAALGILIGLIPAIPYIIFQINSSPFCPDCQTFLKYQQSFRAFDSYNFFRPFQIIGGLGFHFVLGKNYTDFTTVYPLVNHLKYIFTTGFLATLMGILFIFCKKRKYFFLVIYFAAIPLLYYLTKTTAYMHYFVIIIPVSILLFAVSITSLYSLVGSKFLKTSIIAYFVLFIISNTTFLIIFYRFLNTQKHIEGDYGPIYSVTKSFIEKETSEYNSLPYYYLLKSYAFIYAQSPNLHTKLGEYFLERGEYNLAAKEFQK